MINISKGACYLVTGATGFLGTPLVKRLLSKGADVRALSRNEGALVRLKQECPTVEIFPGDVSDEFEVRQAMRGIDGVFHLAASKHVGLAETFVRECNKTNIIGSMNILANSAALDFVLAVSTDKAAQVSGVYGASKFIMEKLFGQYERLNPDTKYRIVRYGNVIYSTGSVLCKWREAIQKDETIVVTDQEATRFFWTVDQALDLIEDNLKNATSSSPYCPDMKSIKIADLLSAMIEMYGDPGKQYKIKTIGLQRGENLHEKILETGPTSFEVPRFSIEEIRKMI